jgi:SAM-dependent methyltransferase
MSPRVSQARPLWRRIAGRIRRALHHGLTIVDRLRPSRRDALLPPAHLRIYYYRTADPAAFAGACASARTEVLSHGLAPHHRVLDVGSGIGNLALGLHDFLTATYDGLEIHPEAVAWCQRAITPRYPAFRFHRADVASRAYNPAGTTAAASYRFPFENHAFDFVMLGSVFTHMLPDEVAHYLREIARVLEPGGVAVVSWFLLDDESRPSVDDGRSFMSFEVRHPSGVCRLHDAAVPEAAVTFEETFALNAIAAAGLRVRDRRRGAWATGRTNDQDVLRLVSDPEVGTIN